MILFVVDPIRNAADRNMEEKDKDEAVNELNGNSVGYLGYQKEKTA